LNGAEGDAGAEEDVTVAAGADIRIDIGEWGGFFGGCGLGG
jgi:hypothetical protein